MALLFIFLKTLFRAEKKTTTTMVKLCKASSISALANRWVVVVGVFSFALPVAGAGACVVFACFMFNIYWLVAHTHVYIYTLIVVVAFTPKCECSIRLHFASFCHYCPFTVQLTIQLWLLRCIFVFFSSVLSRILAIYVQYFTDDAQIEMMCE